MGQEHVMRTLQGALVSGRVGHAYLFCGPRGTGKTTTARLLSKSLNCEKRQLSIGKFEPCNSCHSCMEINQGRSMDLIEIDAASNRGIDEIRNIKESASVAASSSIHKIFLIDEVHMLTPPAFNALLKVLEEPPAHVVFVLATTEAHKIPETVLSRVQRLDFKNLNKQQITEKLLGIAKKEKILIDDDALADLVSSASGSLRDAESSFNKVIAYSDNIKRISAKEVSEILGIVPTQIIESITEFIIAKNPQAAIAKVNELNEAGVNLNQFLKQFINYLRNRLISNTALGTQPVFVSVSVSRTGVSVESQEFLIKALKIFINAARETKSSPVPQLPIELAIFELTNIF